MEGILNSYRDKLKPFGHDNLNVFIQADPTGKKYVRWIVDSYVNGGIRRDEDLLARVKPALENYEYLKSRNILNRRGELWQQETNIDNFCGIVGCTKKGFEKPGLEDLIDKYKDQLEQVEVETSNTAVQIYNGNQIRIIQPTTKEDACYYGQSTRWCTAAREDNMFDEYNRNGPLYIIIPKHPSYKDEKYQLSFETEQYMDEKDDPVQLEDLVNKYPEIESGLQKYFLPLNESDVSDHTTALYNVNRAIKEDNLDIFKQIMSNFPNIEADFGKIKSVEFYDYVVGIRGEFDNRTRMNIIIDAIYSYNNEMFDKLFKLAPIYYKDVTITIQADNLYAYKKLMSQYSSSSQIKHVNASIFDGAPNILEYLLDLLSLDKNDFSLYILNSLNDRITMFTSQKDKTQKVVDVLDSKGFIDRELVKDYIIQKNALGLLDFISFDSRTALEITSIVENKLLRRQQI